MWSTVMVLFIEAMVRLGDVDACRTLRGAFEHQVGSNLITGSGLICFGRAERYLGIAVEGDSAGNSVLWSNESR